LGAADSDRILYGNALQLLGANKPGK
jgi:hypothetical protein